MTTQNPSAPEFKEGFKAGFHEGVEQAREELKKKDEKKEEKKPEEKKPEKPSPVKEKLGQLIHNRVFQVVAIIVLLLVIVYFIYHASTHESTDDAYTAGRVHNIASRVTGTVIALRVDDNQAVKQDDELVILDPTDFKVQVDQAEADYEKAVADDERAKKLQGSGAISKQDYDQFSASRKVAAAKLKDAQNQLLYTVIKSPSDGRVGHRSIETGNRINAGAAVMAVVEEVWVVANFKETQLAKMRVGQPATIKIDAIPGKTFRGHLDSWAPGSGAVFALLPPDNATGNFTKIVQRVPVKIRFDADSIKGYENRIVPGLSCEPEIHLDGGEENRSSPLYPQLESIPPHSAR